MHPHPPHTDDPTPYCSEVARLSGAPLAGSATQATWWLLLEYTRPWQAEATRDNSLPAAVQARLAEVEAAGGRVQCLRQFGRNQPPWRCYVALTGADEQRLFRFDLAHYADLLTLDLAALRQGAAYREHVSTERLTLVCTNGKRDRCCARFGAEVYRHWLALPSDNLWQTTHLGGHRYAAVVLWLPEGVQYGYVRPEDGPALTAARRQGHIWLENWRGRTFYAPVAQAADAYLRAAWGLAGLADVSVVDSAETAPGRWQVTLQIHDGRQARVQLQSEISPPELVSCSPAKTKTAVRFVALNLTRLDRACA